MITVNVKYTFTFSVCRCHTVFHFFLLTNLFLKFTLKFLVSALKTKKCCIVKCFHIYSIAKHHILQQTRYREQHHSNQFFFF